jgi:hypothetical protein
MASELSERTVHGYRWGVCMAVPALPAAAQFIVLLFCPESPRHLYITERREMDAVASIRFYQGEKNVEVCSN